MTETYPEVLVLRHPQREGNYVFWVAELPRNEASDLRKRLSRGEAADIALGHSFGRPLSLDEVMRKLRSRDFQVLDCPTDLTADTGSR